MQGYELPSKVDRCGSQDYAEGPIHARSKLAQDKATSCFIRLHIAHVNVCMCERVQVCTKEQCQEGQQLDGLELRSLAEEVLTHHAGCS